jgi:hypothetical protein
MRPASPEFTLSGTTMAASSTSACPDGGSLQKQRVEKRPEAFTRALKRLGGERGEKPLGARHRTGTDLLVLLHG